MSGGVGKVEMVNRLKATAWDFSSTEVNLDQAR